MASAALDADLSAPFIDLPRFRLAVIWKGVLVLLVADSMGGVGIAVVDNEHVTLNPCCGTLKESFLSARYEQMGDEFN